MLITDKIVFFELQKTGCSHTKEILTSINKDNHKNIGVHNSFGSVNNEYLVDFESKLKIGNVRNPWDWYVSLWSYGSMKRGRLYRKVSYKPNFKSINGIKIFVYKLWKTRSLNQVFYSKKWREVYSDPYNPEYFRAWLKMILDRQDLPISDSYKTYGISKEIGYFTYLYLMLYNYNARNKFPLLKNYADVIAFDRENNYMDLIIRNESIHESLIENGHNIGSTQDEVRQVIRRDFQKRSNKSNRDSDYRNYYDEETIELVKNKDRLIIDKYNYKF